MELELRTNTFELIFFCAVFEVKALVRALVSAMSTISMPLISARVRLVAASLA